MPRFAAAVAEHHGGFSTRLLLLLLLLLRSATYVVDGQTPSAPSTSPVEATFEPTLTLAPSVSPRPIAPVTPLPTSSTVTPTYAPRECWDNFTDMYFDLGRQPAFSTNTYVICPNRTYDIGYKEGNNGDCCANGQLPIVCRANTHFKCGKDGSRSNKCILNGGSDQIVFNEVIFSEEMTGVILEGFTFRGPADYTMIGVGGGDVTFLDCLFEDQQNAGPIVTVYNPGELRRGRKLQENPEAVLEYGDTPWKRLQYVQRPEYLKQLRSAAAAAAAAASAAAESVKLESAATEDQKRDLQGSGMLVMNFEDCIFQNCSQGDFKDKYATYGVISSLTAANVVNVKNCIFAYNVFNGLSQWGTTGYAISIHQSDLILSNTCFLDNEFAGYGTVEIFDRSAFQLNGNYLSGNTSQLRCPFAAYSDVQPTTPLNITTCLAPNATTCQSTLYESWKETLARGTPSPSAPGPQSAPTAQRPTLPPRPTREPGGPTSAGGRTHGSLLRLCLWLFAVRFSFGTWQ